MTILRQVALLPAGCQPWNLNVVTARGQYFAYAATLAVYVYKQEQKYGEFRLHSILTEHNKTVTSIEWHPNNDSLLLTASCDPRICVWNISHHTILRVLDNPRCTPLFASWVSGHDNIVAYVEGRGPVYLWEAKEDGSHSQMKEISSFASSISQMRWHPSAAQETVAFGHYNSTVSISIANKVKRHVNVHSVAYPDDKTPCDDNPVTSLEWDPQSSNYLLVALGYSQILLVDVAVDVGVQVVTTYTAPSRATMMRSVAWIPGASGMFITGDLEAGVLRVWNVARPTPLENILLKQTGFHALHVMSGNGHSASSSYEELRGSARSKQRAMAANGGGSKQQPSKTAESSRGYEVPKAKVVALFGDGGVGVYSLRSRRWNFLREMVFIAEVYIAQGVPKLSQNNSTAC